MYITERREGSLTFLDLVGRFEVSAGEVEVHELRAAIARLVVECRPCVALYLADLLSLDARGLGELVAAHNALRAAGGMLILVKVVDRVRRMLAVTRLDTILPLCDSERDAVELIRVPTQMSHIREGHTVRLSPTHTTSMAVTTMGGG